ncbi:MAG: hypothetical protein M1820_008760 [Bogoriella megaspora]|nr:MAG: hypothetical protein M1820_008760 [Bogoriella megaspora]
MPGDANAKLALYNYAARFGLIPKFDLSAHPSESAVIVTITLPELDLKTSAVGESLRIAESAGALQFKQLISGCHSRIRHRELIKGNQPLFSAETAIKVLDLYKSQKGRCSVSVAINDVRLTTGKTSEGSRRYVAFVTVNGQRVGEQVYFKSEHVARSVAQLTAAIHLFRQDESLRNHLLNSPKSNHATNTTMPTAKRAMPDGLSLKRETLDLMAQAVSFLQSNVEYQKAAQSDVVTDTNQSTKLPRLRSEALKRLRNARLKQMQDALEQDPGFSRIWEEKASLPIRQQSTDIERVVQSNTYSIVIGETGSGKTTQVPQILFESAISQGLGGQCTIICTQPRRIAAASVARRVSEERKEELQDTVGYSVRFDHKPPPEVGSIMYCTTGILLARLEEDPEAVLDGFSHLVLDEVHERDILIDFLMVVLKKAIGTRLRAKKPVPKVILMSATIDAGLFANYFGSDSGSGGKLLCPSISIPGRLYPVHKKFFDDIISDLKYAHRNSFHALVDSDKETAKYISLEQSYTQISSSETTGDPNSSCIPIGLVGMVVAHIALITSGGAILVFLPGIQEIQAVEDLILGKSPLGVNFSNGIKFRVFKLHSSLRDSQSEVFRSLPAGCRKIILSTNIAETSITISDVQYVVDTGKLREKGYNQGSRITTLQTSWASKNNVKQRAGRAGRVREGQYYALYSQTRFASFEESGLPEMLRSDLQAICLSAKLHSKVTGIREFLAGAIQPPSATAVNAALQDLRNLQALAENEDLTPLGRLLARLPVHPSLGKMIILGLIMKCFDPMLILGAADEQRSLFVRPLENRAEAIEAHAEYFEATNSDHIALINAYHELRQIREERGESAARRWASQKFLHYGTFSTIEKSTNQIELVLVETGLIPRISGSQRRDGEIGGPRLNENAGNVAIVKALSVAGLYPNIAVQTSNVFLQTQTERSVMISNSSINACKKQDKSISNQGRLFTFTTMMKDSNQKQLMLRDTNLITPIMALFFGGKLDVKAPGTTIEMDGWLPYHFRDGRTAAQTVLQFRKCLDTLLFVTFKDFSRLNDEQGSTLLTEDVVRDKFVNALGKVLSSDLVHQRQIRGE